MVNIQTRPLARFGAEIVNFDLQQTHDEETIAQIRQVWLENGVVLFRNQSLKEADIVAFSRQFGELEIHVRKEYLCKGYPELLQVSNIKQDGQPVGILADHEVGWHHDQIYLPKPALGSLLYSVKIPPQGGNTAFINLADAYDALPEATRSRFDSLNATHSYEYFNRAWSEPTSEQQKKLTPDVVHPLVRTHPETGRKAIYADPGMTSGIAGMPEEEGRELLDDLFEHCISDRFLYEHEWRVGDAIMWDNAATMHKRGDFDPTSERMMQRTTILPPAVSATPY